MRRGAQLFSERLVVPVHGEDQVEGLEVFNLDLPRPQRRQVVTTLARMPLAALIRRRAGVVVVRAGGVDVDLVCQAQRRNAMAQHALGRGAAADVAHADEEDLIGAQYNSQKIWKKQAFCQ